MQEPQDAFTLRLCCFGCRQPFLPDARVGAREVYADGERLVMMCGKCADGSRDRFGARGHAHFDERPEHGSHNHDGARSEEEYGWELPESDEP